MCYSTGVDNISWANCRLPRTKVHHFFLEIWIQNSSFIFTIPGLRTDVDKLPSDLDTIHMEASSRTALITSRQALPTTISIISMGWGCGKEPCAWTLMSIQFSLVHDVSIGSPLLFVVQVYRKFRYSGTSEMISGQIWEGWSTGATQSVQTRSSYQML